MNFTDFLFGGFFVHPRHPPSPRDPRNSPDPKKLLDTYNIKKQAQYQKDVKTDCDSIININLQKVHGDHHIYKDI